MAAGYKKLWKVLIDKGMKRDLEKRAHKCNYTMNELNYGANGMTDIRERISVTLE